MESKEYNQIKVVFLGLGPGGKSCLIKVATGQKFDSFSLDTSSSSYETKVIHKNKKNYELQLWDMTGQERFLSLNKIFIMNSKIVVLVYDITIRATFEKLNHLYELAKESVGNDAIFGIVGNKSDLFMDEKVSEEEGKRFAESIGAKFALTSAKYNPEDISIFLEELLDEYLRKNGKIENEGENNEIYLKKNGGRKKSKKKCIK